MKGRITIHQFEDLSDSWSLDDEFTESFKRALRMQHDTALVPASEKEKRWMCVYGFEFKRKGDKYEVEL